MSAREEWREAWRRARLRVNGESVWPLTDTEARSHALHVANRRRWLDETELDETYVLTAARRAGWRHGEEHRRYCREALTGERGDA